jgi:hypothetical protein
MAADKSNAPGKSKKSNRGGRRPGAGRKPAAQRSTDAKCLALSRALSDLETKAASQFHADFAFFLAMNCLEGDPDAAVTALGIARDEFCQRFGPAFLAWKATHRDGAATAV